jgi:transcriptional regulator with XRE-family HTH domain
MNKSIGDRLKKLREKTGMKQKDLAQKVGIDRASLAQIENNKRALRAEEIAIFSRNLNVSADQLLGIEPLPEIFLEPSNNPSKETAAMRISIPAENKEKFKEVLLYILSKIGAKPTVGETVIYKHLYFIDFDYYEKFEEQLIGATYIKNHYGPTPVEFQSIVDRMITDKEIELVKSQHFQYPQKKYLPCREPDLSLFNANELQMINEVLNKLSNMNAHSISEYSHQDVPWIVTPLNHKIDYEAVFYRTPPYSVREYEDADIQ